MRQYLLWMQDMKTAMSIEEQTAWEGGLLLVLCLLIALGALASLVWALIAGVLLTLDGMLLAAVCLLLVVLFGGNVAWAFRTGEAQAILRGLSARRSSQKE